MAIVYTVGVERPSEHRAQFSIELTANGAPYVDLVLPAWVPGSYHIQDPARSVRDVTASTDARARPLAVTRIDKARWRVRTDGAERLEVRYVVYGHQMIDEALDVTPEHLFLNAALCLPYVDGRKEEPCELVLHVPPTWRVYAELDELGRHPPRFRAPDYDALVDAPVDCGTPVERSMIAAGIPHRILLCGQGSNVEPHRLEEDLRRIAETAIRLFGESPLTHYTFFYHLADVSDGALEHRASVSTVLPRSGFRPASSYRRVLLVAAHEYFHLYNVKRIRPRVLGPFDYTRENYTRLLWAMEGTTDYYAHLLLRRADLISPARLLEMFAELARRYLETPGRAVVDLETASLQTWIDLYRPYEETVNQSVSYYLKGGLVSWMLDLDIRARTENRASLDAVMRELWRAYGAAGRGLAEDELEPVMARVTGLDLGPFFERYVRGTAEIDFAAFVRHAGLAFGPKPKPPAEPDDDAPTGHLGVRLENRDGFPRIAAVLDHGPARRAGLSPGDEIVALDGEKVRFDTWPKRLAQHPAGDALTLTVFRRGLLTTVPVTLGEAPPEKYRFQALPEATPLQKAIYEGLFAAPWAPPASPPA